MLRRTLIVKRANLDLLGQCEPEMHGRITLAGPIPNAGGCSFSAIGLRAAKEPLIEVDLSNIYQRETFRQHSYVSLGGEGRDLWFRSTRLAYGPRCVRGASE